MPDLTTPTTHTVRETRSPFSKRIDPLTGLLLLVSIGCCLLIGLHWLSPLDFLLWVVFSVFTALPGWTLGIALGGKSRFRRIEFWAAGAILGWAVSSYVVLLAGYLLGGVRLWPLWLVGLLSIIVASIFRRRQSISWPALLDGWGKAETRILALAVALVMIFLTRPFLSVGAPTPDGYAFPWLFGFDFANRVSIAANAAVSLPPKFFHIHGETFHYYMLTYMIPVGFKQFTGSTAEMFSTLVVWCVNLAVVFAVILVSVLRVLVRNWKALLWSVLTVFVSYSFYWLYVAAKLYARGHHNEFPATIAGGAWMTYSNVSHLLYRYFLVEPQTVLSMALLLIILGYFILCRGHLRHKAAAVGIGFMLGCVFGVDALLTLWTALGIGTLALFDLARTRQNRRGTFFAWFTAGFVFAVMAALYYLVGMYSAQGSRSLIVGLHGTLAKIFPVFMFVEFGPLLVFGLIGSGYLFYRDKAAGVVWWVLAIAAVFAVLFVQAQYDDQLGLLKGSRFLFILFALATGVFWRQYTERRQSKTANIVCVVILLAALPTWATDWLMTSNTADRSETVYVYPADYQACRWIKSTLPPDAVVQSSPAHINYHWTDKPDPYMYPLIANFAERPMAVGGWGMPQMIPDIQDKFYRTIADVKAMFKATAVESVVARLDQYDIDYLYYGPWERKRWPAFESLLDSRPEIFAKEYDRNEVKIYRIVRQAP